MAIKLYGTLPSPPSHSARLMLEFKGLDYEAIWLLPGLHPLLLRTRGFRGGTVPAIKLDGRKLQQSRAISRALDELKPEPPLFPEAPEKRLAVEEAERWGDEVLQDVPRRIIRWLSVHRPETRVMIAREIGVPLPRFAAWINAPSARYMANKVDSDAEIQNHRPGAERARARRRADRRGRDRR
jgi:glutathione S-transferase